MIESLEQQAWQSVSELREQVAAVQKLDAATSLRLHRSLSWLDAAQNYQQDRDMCFINLSIAFKSLVKTADDSLDFEGFSQYLFSVDPEADLYELFWHEYNSIIRQLIKNPFLYTEFWQAQYQRLASVELESDENWRLAFEKESVAALNALSRHQGPVILNIILSRLFVLQQQVIEGGATYQSQVNRQQIDDGVSILLVLLPRIITLMIASDEVWQEAAYPVIDKQPM